MGLQRLPSAKPKFDPSRRYVRFHELRDDGYVLFDFAIGDPELSVNLTLKLDQYREFCRTQNVTHVTREQGVALDEEHLKWRFGKPGVQT